MPSFENAFKRPWLWANWTQNLRRILLGQCWVENHCLKSQSVLVLNWSEQIVFTDCRWCNHFCCGSVRFGFAQQFSLVLTKQQFYTYFILYWQLKRLWGVTLTVEAWVFLWVERRHDALLTFWRAGGSLAWPWRRAKQAIKMYQSLYLLNHPFLFVTSTHEPTALVAEFTCSWNGSAILLDLELRPVWEL